MEDVLDLYEAPYDPARPIVCFDESPKQLIGEVRTSLPPQPGTPARQDIEYQRNGVRNLMMICEPNRTEPKRGWREVLVMAQRTRVEFAHCMRHIVQRYPEAEIIRVVLDNLNTHKPASLYAAFAPEEARAIARKLEFHYTPKHGSWLNMAEIEIGIMVRQCLDRRIDNMTDICNEVAAWEKARNKEKRCIHWTFTVAAARVKLKNQYPSIED